MIKEAEQLIDENTRTVHFLKGAMDDQDWNLHSWFGAADTMGQEFTQPAWPGVMQPPAPPVEDPPMTGRATVKAAPKKKRGRPPIKRK